MRPIALFRWVPLWLVLACWGLAPDALAEVNDKKPAVHTVYRGQTLAMIAKRYRVSVAAICHASDIRTSDPIQPGDKLLIPALADKDGSQARARRAQLLGSGKAETRADEPSRSESPERAKGARKKPTAQGAQLQRHTVYRGQTLGMIAQRYHVTVDAIAYANHMEPSDPIHPEDELIIPGPNDPDGKLARAKHRKQAHRSTKSSAKPRIHRVASGHTLGQIAARYSVTVEALCRANGIRRTAAIQPGQDLVVPAPGEDGTEARAWGKRWANTGKQQSPGDWRMYRKQAWRRGYVVLESPTNKRRWKGYVLGPGNKLLPLARQKVSDVLASWRTGAKTTIHPRLVRLVAELSDTFGGRPIQVVSGYREHSHSKGSKHPAGKALDFSVSGVPNWAVRDYLRRLPNVGVGYYPNSSFLHLDVRDQATYWVDASGPGEPPRYIHRSAGRKR